MSSRALLVCGILALAAPPAMAAPAVGEKAPELKGGKWYNVPGGLKQLSLGTLSGRIVMVEFWATW